MFKRLGNLRSREWQMKCLVSTCSQVIFLVEASHGRKVLSWVSLIKALTPLMRAPSSWPYQHSKAPPPIPSHWGLGFNIGFWRTQHCIIYSICAVHSFIYSVNIFVLDALVEQIEVKTLFEKKKVTGRFSKDYMKEWHWTESLEVRWVSQMRLGRRVLIFWIQIKWCS